MAPEDGDAGGRGDHLLEPLHALHVGVIARVAQTGNVPARPRETGDQAAPDRVRDRGGKDGDGAGGLLGGAARRGAYRQDEIELQVDQLGRELRQPIVDGIREAVFNADVPSILVAVLAQPPEEVLDQVRPTFAGADEQEADARHPRRPLTWRRQGRAAGEQAEAGEAKASAQEVSTTPRVHGRQYRTGGLSPQSNQSPTAVAIGQATEPIQKGSLTPLPAHAPRFETGSDNPDSQYQLPRSLERVSYCHVPR